MHAATSKVDNSAQGSSCNLKFVHGHWCQETKQFYKIFDQNVFFLKNSSTRRSWVQSSQRQRRSNLPESEAFIIIFFQQKKTIFTKKIQNVLLLKRGET